ncbi:MAG: hypothetical protein PR2021_4270 [Candidatus Phytoplasma pruni]|nr:MAG: hypothetical protein PR2021_4270 [Candidatus Phytoplasma pruni]
MTMQQIMINIFISLIYLFLGIFVYWFFGVVCRYLNKKIKEENILAVKELKKNGFSVKELLDAGYDIYDLVAAGYTYDELRVVGFTFEELIYAGFTAEKES